MTIPYIAIVSFKKDNRGSTVVLLSVLVLATVLTIVLASSEVLSNGLQEDKLQLDSTKAYFAAEAGAERLLYQVRNALLSCNDDECVNFSTNTCDGACDDADKIQILLTNSRTYKVRYNLDGFTNIFTSTGKCGTASRVVELRY